MNKKPRLTILLWTAAMLLALNSCGNTRVVSKSPLLQTNPQEPYSTVYFLRSTPRQILGLADDAIDIEINGVKTVELARGEYVMLRLLPMEATVTVKSMSKIGGKEYPQQVSGSETFNFAAGQTNFVHLKAVNEEFRGIHFRPERIEFNQARVMARDLRAIGEAKKRPIDKL